MPHARRGSILVILLVGGLAQDDAFFRGREVRDRDGRGETRRSTPANRERPKHALPGSVRRAWRGVTNAPIANAPWSGSTRDPGSNLWRREPDHSMPVARSQELLLCGDGNPASAMTPEQVPVSDCNEDARSTSSKPPQTERTLPKAGQTAAFWRSIDALAPYAARKALAWRWLPISPKNRERPRDTACRKDRVVPHLAQPPGSGGR